MPPPASSVPARSIARPVPADRTVGGGLVDPATQATGLVGSLPGLPAPGPTGPVVGPVERPGAPSDALRERGGAGGRRASAAAEAFGQLPLSFEANRGQTDPQVRFLSRGPGYTLFLTPTEAVFSLRKAADPGDGHGDQAGPDEAAAVHMQLVGANPDATLLGRDELPGGSITCPPTRRDGRPTSRPSPGSRSPGSSTGRLVYYGNQRQLEYDFQVAPGADPSAIVLAFAGADAMEVDAAGDLVLHTAAGDVREHAPVLYQDIGGVRQAVEGGYVLLGDDRVGFRVGSYEPGRALVIDPVLAYSTDIESLGWDGEPMTSPWTAPATPTSPGRPAAPTSRRRPGPSRRLHFRSFVMKLNADGSAPIYSTYINATTTAIAIDAAGHAYVTGGAPTSGTIPDDAGRRSSRPGTAAAATPSSWSWTRRARACCSGPTSAGTWTTGGQDLALDAAGNIYLAGTTDSPNLPAGQRLPVRHSTPAAAINPKDAFVARLSPDASTLVYSTFLGGGTWDMASAIAVDGAGNATVTGTTWSSASFPTTAGAYNRTATGHDVWVARFQPAGGLAYSTFLYNGDSVDIALDASGDAFITGDTISFTFPTTPGAFQEIDDHRAEHVRHGAERLGQRPGPLHVPNGGPGLGDDAGTARATCTWPARPRPPSSRPIAPCRCRPTDGADAFLAQFDPTLSALDFSTRLGGEFSDAAGAVALDAAGAAYLAGGTSSIDFPTTAGASRPRRTRARSTTAGGTRMPS